MALRCVSDMITAQQRTATKLKCVFSNKCHFLFVPTVECLSSTLWGDVPAVFDTRRISSQKLLKVRVFSVLIEHLILRGGPAHMICDITNT